MKNFIESKMFLIAGLNICYLFCFGYFFIPLQDEYNETLMHIFKSGHILNGFMCIGVGVCWAGVAYLSFKTMQYLSFHKKKNQ